MNMISNTEQMKIIDSFVTDLEKSLGVAQERMSFEGTRDLEPPPEAGNLSIQEYMKNASRDSFFYDDYHNFDQFRQDYLDKFGRTPYVSPPVRWQW
jgi:hypothetical protein